MGLEQVKDGILAEGRAAAERELAKAREEAKGIKTRADAKAAGVRAANQQRVEAAVQALRRRELALAELEAKKLRLRAQKELLAAVRAQAVERLRKLPPKQNDEYLTALVQKAMVKDARIHTRPEDKPLIERMGHPWAGPIEAVGGVVVESADGSSREDLLYEHLLDDAWRDALGEVAEQLFGKTR
jgi:V/A-type H+-transporting ATPase subunit E